MTDLRVFSFILTLEKFYFETTITRLVNVRAVVFLELKASREEIPMGSRASFSSELVLHAGIGAHPNLYERNFLVAEEEHIANI